MIAEFERYETRLYEFASRLVGSARCPIALRPICRDMGVHSIRRDKLSEAKSILVDASVKPVIILSTPSDAPTIGTAPFTPLERFLIAHELGHLVLRQFGAKNPAGRSEYWKAEKVCDTFARRLLIPDHAIRG